MLELHFAANQFDYSHVCEGNTSQSFTEKKKEKSFIAEVGMSHGRKDEMPIIARIFKCFCTAGIFLEYNHWERKTALILHKNISIALLLQAFLTKA